VKVKTSFLSRLTCYVSPVTSFSLLTSHLSRVYLELWPEVGPQQHAHVHPPQRVPVQYHSPDAQRCAHGSSTRQIAATHEDPGRVDHPIGVAEKHHIQPIASEYPSCYASGAGTTGSVQDLDLDPAIGERHCIRMSHDLLGPGLLKQHGTNTSTEQDAGRDQCEAKAVPARLFQKRKVGSGMGHAERMR
jgi:hypothetical protein